MKNIFKFVVVGAGPAGLCAIAKLIGIKIAPDNILWVDPLFAVGDFGTVLSVGSSVPGNTKVENYIKVIAEMNAIIQSIGLPPVIYEELDSLDKKSVCTLKVATRPMQEMTQRFQSIIPYIDGKVISIEDNPNLTSMLIKNNEGKLVTVKAEKVILATGSLPRQLNNEVIASKIEIDCNIAFIESELNGYLEKYKTIKSVAVVGSSHSAALAVMQLVKAGCEVHHFMIGEYRYAQSKISPDGKPYVKFDNTGLKGDVAEFTKNISSSQYHQYQASDKTQIDHLMKLLSDRFTHVVSAIGYEVASSLEINHKSLSHYIYDKNTLKLVGLSNVFGVGIAFPQAIIGYEGEQEVAVGVGKFWATVNDSAVIGLWLSDHLKTSQLSFFNAEITDQKSLAGDEKIRINRLA